MKKYMDRAMIFAVYGLCAGVYFREFTKFNSFNARTMLGMAHPHILMLGMAGFMLVALFVRVLNIEDSKKLRIADTVYISGIIAASAMMLLRGTMEVSGIPISSGMNGAISGIAGLGHIATAAGIIRYIGIFRKAA